MKDRRDKKTTLNLPWQRMIRGLRAWRKVTNRDDALVEDRHAISMPDPVQEVPGSAATSSPLRTTSEGLLVFFPVSIHHLSRRACRWGIMG